MGTGIILPEIYIANLMGILICLMALIGNRWKVSGTDSEKKALRLMFVVTLFSCVADPLIFTVDGRPGMLAFLAVFIGNSWLYLSNVILGPAWLIMVILHIEGGLRKYQKVIIWAFCALGAILLLINIFVPVAFSVDENNVYSRGPLFWVFLVIEICFIVYGVAIFMRAKVNGGILKFFPVWQFIVPAAFGITVQCCYYGVSVIWPCVTISLNGMMFCLQSEATYQDQMTGIYNKAYLENMIKEMARKRQHRVAAMMLDLNNFKYINDNHGHLVGDEALIECARTIKMSVGTLGSAIRYAGDEFLVLLNTDNPDEVENCAINIQKNLKKVRIDAEPTYQFSVSIGYCIADPKTQSLNEIMENIDQKMYKNKAQFYEMHPELDRRNTHN